MRGFAAPVFDAYRRPVAAVSVAAPVGRLKNGQIADYAGMIKAAAREVTAIWSDAPA